ncbi:hypothetical protein BJY21_000516 [Kineosphaera limosa]|uniref:DUF1540 domain-containing protein n=1 Tax=Kineosphaera limosa NBRC 100340 TaxID=1184609 RepID=K6WRJ5_9MICO|nr:DUF1540 domain-containing protein [Kineosphaera limosa]NYD99331.1 hypothetical protein [Kineosphaera limosa]GAB94712.1 hypothetical protein KILIM_010_00430 [Kineosphaera limosa NBRC 100340]
MPALATVTSCSTTACSYNTDGCTAFAITVGGASGAASCGTFVALDARGGLPTADSHVGACQRLECRHNNDLMCTAEAITVGGDNAACELYEAS